MMIDRFQPLRRLAGIAQAVLIIGIPFLRIGGESAFRFDIPSLKLHFLGTSLWMNEFFIILIAIIFLTFLLLLLTLLFGRVWCGWACPQTVLADFTKFIERTSGKGFISKFASHLLVLAVSVLVAANLIWYFVSPYDFFSRLASGSLGNVIRGFWIVLSVVLFLNIVFLRRTFCAAVCPYARLQSVLYDKRTLVICFDSRREEECMNCTACVRACPVGIDIRDGLNAACISCALCIDRCRDMLAARRREGLIGYFWGAPGPTRMTLRPPVILIGSITAAFLGFLIYLSLTRVSLDMTVLPDFAYSPRRTGEDRVANAYILALENKEMSERDLKVAAAAGLDEVTITPERIALEPGEYKRVTVFVVLKQATVKANRIPLEITVEDSASRTTVTGKTNFMIPGE